MLNKIIHTLGSRAITVLLNLALLFITTKWMGAENKGEISLFILNLSLASILSGLFGGPSLVYLTPRFSFKQLIVINYSWSIIVSILMAFAFKMASLPLTVSVGSFIIISILECISATNILLLLGQEKIKQHNWIQIFKVSVTAIILLYLHFSSSLSFESFVFAYCTSLVLTFIVSLLTTFKGKHKIIAAVSPKIIVKESFKYGLLVQIGSITQLFNYRLSYYVLELVISPPKLALIRIGIFHTAVQVAEALWQFARSISTVQYSHISNLDNRAAGLDISIKLTKLNYLATLAGIIVLVLLPTEFYTSIFGEDFHEVKKHIIILAPGIFMVAISNAFSHFFAGVGDHKFNTYSSVFGFLLTALLIYPSVLYFGTLGAAAITTLVHCSQTIYQYTFLKKKDNVPISSFFFRSKDVTDLKLIFSRFKRRFK